MGLGVRGLEKFATSKTGLKLYKWASIPKEAYLQHQKD